MMMTVFMMYICKTHEGDLILKVYDGYINAGMYTRYVNVINSIVIFSNQCFVCISFNFCLFVVLLLNQVMLKPLVLLLFNALLVILLTFAKFDL